METTLYLVRHGETEENVKLILQGHLPGHLTKKGKEQAKKLHELLAARHFDAILCSDLQRCVDTAAIVSRGHSAQTVLEPLLRERDWGAFTGKKLMAIRGQAFPDDVESEADMYARAARFLNLVQERYANKRVLAISHGLFCRAVQAEFYGKTIHDIQRMDNAEMRVLTFNDRKTGTQRTDIDKNDEITAN